MVTNRSVTALTGAVRTWLQAEFVDRRCAAPYGRGSAPHPRLPSETDGQIAEQKTAPRGSVGKGPSSRFHRWYVCCRRRSFSSEELLKKKLKEISTHMKVKVPTKSATVFALVKNRKSTLEHVSGENLLTVCK